MHDRDLYAAGILDSMAAHVAVLSSDGRIQDVNRAWLQFARDNACGEDVTRASSVGIDYVALCRACSGEKAEEALPAADGIEDVLQGRRSFFSLEYPCDSPTESRWFAMHVSPLSATDGGAVVAHYDITARKQAELALAAQSRRMELAMTAARMGVWTIDVGSGRIQWSTDVYSIVGVDAFDGTLASWERLVHPDDLRPMQALFNQAMATRQPFVGEFRVVPRDGDVRWLANVAKFECGPTGAVDTIVGTVQDITARKRSEWSLTAYNAILELIAFGADLGLILEMVLGLVEQQLPGVLCSVHVLDPLGNRLRFAAGKSLPAAYNLAVDAVPVGPTSGACGAAAYRAAIVAVGDIASDPLWAPYRDVALRHGLRSCISLPIFSSGNVPGHERGKVIGTFALYHRMPGEFDRLSHEVITGAQDLVRRTLVEERGAGWANAGESARIVEAIHLAGVAIERDQAGKAVRESDERFRVVVDSAPSAIYMKHLDGRFVFVNPATATLFGLPQTAWPDRRTTELLPAKLAARFDACDEAALTAPGAVESRITGRLPDGREVVLLATHVLLRRDGGEPYAISGVLRDITDLVLAQREFERLWLHASDPLAIAGFDGRIKQLNPAWTELLGWSEEELLRMPYSELVHADDLAGMLAIERRVLRGETIRGYENRFRCRDGSYRWFSWNAIAEPEDQLIYGIARDVTEERRLAEQVRQAQKMEAIGQLASGVAHDFNNLLTIINGYTAILLNKTLADDPRRDALTQVQVAGGRATELTSQLLAFSRKAIVEPVVLDVNQVIESATRMLRRLIGENIRLETALQATLPVRIDPGQFDQVLMNLAVNARDAMPDGGRLSISTESLDVPGGASALANGPCVGPCVRIGISDTGCGMPPEIKSRVFEPFFTTKGPGSGTGLGLATVYGIVQQAGGAIEVESEIGSGTTFRILLPAVQDLVTRAEQTESILTPRGTETVLIAEDEEGVRSVASAILEAEGYRVLTARSGAEAVATLRDYAGQIDLLLADVIMPDFGGRILAERALAQRPALRVLYMSGYFDDSVIRAGIESSRDWFIQKPFTPLTLARRVRDVLDSTAEALRSAGPRV